MSTQNDMLSNLQKKLQNAVEKSANREPINLFKLQKVSDKHNS